jgi:hypothetical protein
VTDDDKKLQSVRNIPCPMCGSLATHDHNVRFDNAAGGLLLSEPACEPNHDELVEGFAARFYEDISALAAKRAALFAQFQVSCMMVEAWLQKQRVVEEDDAFIDEWSRLRRLRAELLAIDEPGDGKS